MKTISIRCPGAEVKMKNISVAMILTVFAIQASAQPPSLKKEDRPVFESVAELAALCKDFDTVDHAMKSEGANDSISIQAFAYASGCKLYILGYLDDELEHLTHVFGPHYHPVRSHIDYMNSLVATFLKYSKDHPEKQDFAATTALKEVEEIIGKAQTGH
jgi:hypothetical protein